MGRTLPQKAVKIDDTISAEYDRCNTPDHAIWPILKYLAPHSLIWDPCCGVNADGSDGNITRVLRAAGHEVIATDLRKSPAHNMLTMPTPEGIDGAIFNPPFSLKYRVMQNFYERGIPWLGLVPFTTMASGKALEMYLEYGWEELRPTSRINFEMPSTGYCNSGAQFNTTWLGWHMLPQPLTVVHLQEPLPHQRLIPPTPEQVEERRATKRTADLKKLIASYM